LIVTTPEIPSIADAMKIISTCKNTKSKPIGIIVNMYRGMDSNQVKIEEIESTCELPVIGVIPEDKTILANGNLYFIELDESKVNPTFVEVFLQSEVGMTQLNRYAKGAAMKSISIQDLKTIISCLFNTSRYR